MDPTAQTAPLAGALANLVLTIISPQSTRARKNTTPLPLRLWLSGEVLAKRKPEGRCFSMMDWCGI